MPDHLYPSSFFFCQIKAVIYFCTFIFLLALYESLLYQKVSTALITAQELTLLSQQVNYVHNLDTVCAVTNPPSSDVEVWFES